MTEEWRDIKGYEGLYQVSNLGRVKSLPKRKNGGGNRFYIMKGKILKPCANKQYGYRTVTLSKNGKSYKIQLHLLLGRTFLPNPNNHTYIIHLNGDVSDNRLENLQWGEIKYSGMTQSEFEHRANAIHGHKYDYSKFNYSGYFGKGCIICPIHGEFWQAAHSHLRGHGCNLCGHNSSRRTVEGVAMNDLPENAGNTTAYNRWRQMLVRTHNGKYKQLRPSYNNATICDEWLSFSNFKKWFDENYIEGYALDKDILSLGKKHYSPQTCCFVPQEVNSAVVLAPKKGVHPNHGKYETVVCRAGKRRYVGTYETVEEAQKSYMIAKADYLRELGRKYYLVSKIDKRVYDGICQFATFLTLGKELIEE